jgi:hypothetical protein
VVPVRTPAEHSQEEVYLCGSRYPNAAHKLDYSVRLLMVIMTVYLCGKPALHLPGTIQAQLTPPRLIPLPRQRHAVELRG